MPSGKVYLLPVGTLKLAFNFHFSSLFRAMCSANLWHAWLSYDNQTCHMFKRFVSHLTALTCRNNQHDSKPNSIA